MDVLLLRGSSKSPTTGPRGKKLIVEKTATTCQAKAHLQDFSRSE